MSKPGAADLSVRAIAAAALCVLTTGSVPLLAETWSSPLLDRRLVVVEKTTPGSGVGTEEFPDEVASQLGPDFVEYEAFVAARLPEADAQRLEAAALAEGFGVIQESRTPVKLPFHSFEPENPALRSANWGAKGASAKSVPGLFLIRFAFPPKDVWFDELAACGVSRLLSLGNQTLLARAANLGTIKSCNASRYLSWSGPFLTTDRISPEILSGAESAADYTLHFLPGEMEVAAQELPPTIEILAEHRVLEGEPEESPLLSVRATRLDLEKLVETSPSLFAVTPLTPDHLSDERQGQIVAGNHNGQVITPMPGSMNPPYVSYLTWLQNRGLRTASNQQTVAVFDSGYDDGTGPTGAHHLDLEAPERLVAGRNFVTSPTTALADARGHGTMVAGIVAGNGQAGTNAKDSANTYLGTGIAPDSRLVIAKVFDSNAPPGCGSLTITGNVTLLGQAITFSRTDESTGGDLAFISNHSYNSSGSDYNTRSQLFDQRTIDADPVRVGLQPMTFVVSAGNDGPADDTVRAPATAKNVLAVGATQNYRPSTETSAPPNTCSVPVSSTFTQEASHVAHVAPFSARGKHFAAYPSSNLLYNTYIKPDVVAPGGRVFSTVPYQTQDTYTCQGICRKYWPDPPIGYHSYAQGTSFAAPVVAGMAALKRKWFLDRGANPSPSLLKASLIATADDLGYFYTADHRPSNDYGWGRVNLSRLTDSAARFYVTDNAGLAVGTGQERTWTRTIDNPAVDTYIVLTWSDVPSTTTLGSPALVNDLRLTVERVGSAVLWRGNNFNENITGVDNGYSYQYAIGITVFNDTANPVEAIFIPGGTFTAGQQVVIRVTGHSVSSGPQKFAIYAYNVRLSS